MIVLEFLLGRTVVFALDEALPLSEPLHADAQDHRRSLFCLKLFVQLQTGEKVLAQPKHGDRFMHRCR